MEMIGILKEIILDNQKSRLFTGTERNIPLVTVSGKATTCIGVRRAGKSTYMNQIAQNLIADGISPMNMLFVNFFDDRLYGIDEKGLGLIIEAYFSLYPEKKGQETIYCFFDEIQMTKNWEPFVDRIMRTEKCEVFITGSSARMLSKEIASQMRGRAISWEIFPFSFREYLKHNNIQAGRNLSSKERLLLQKAFEGYWETGGFPETLGCKKNMRIKIHQEYFQTILLRDLIERHNISHPLSLTALTHHLINNVANLYSINKLTGMLQSLGHSAPKQTISSYIDGCEDAYFLFPVHIYNASISKSRRNPKKIYAIDHSFVKSISSGILVNSGHLLENLIFIALRRETEKIYYYRTKTGKEVDFMAIMQDGNKMLVQVSETLAEEKTKQREMSALIDAMGETGQKETYIVTRNESDTIDTKQGMIHVVPAWKFLLDIDGDGELKKLSVTSSSLRW